MVVFSTVQYGRFGLTNDFANESQAWWAIAHGHLDPYIGGFGVSYWKNNAEFAMYPLSLLAHIYSQPVVLLWVQETAVVLTEVVAFAWVRKAIERAPGRARVPVGPWLALSAVVVLVVNPWVYETIAFDFHFQTISTLFVILVAYDLWAGRRRRLWVWVPLVLMCNALGGICLVGVGISGVLAGRTYRRRSLLIAAVGLAWFSAMSALGALGDGGRAFSKTYGYLVGPHHGPVGFGAVVAGALRHPGAVVHMAGSHWAVIVSFLVVLGVIGLLSPWGIGMALVVLLPNVLDGSGSFIRYGASFQSWPAMPFILIGSVMVLIRLLEKGEAARQVAAVVMALWAALAGSLALVALPTLPRAWFWVSPSAAAELGRVLPEIPADAEVIVSEPVMGRFGQRSSVYGMVTDGERFPVDRRPVVFVFGPYESFEKSLTPGGITAATRFVRHRLGARVIGSGSTVQAYAWSPPPGTTHVRLP